MKEQLTFWDWIGPLVRAIAPSIAPVSRPAPRAPRSRARKPRPNPPRHLELVPRPDLPIPASLPILRSPASAQARYDAVVRAMLAHHQVRVRRWRSSMSGIAWYVTYRSGKIQRLIEAPRPKGPMSVAVFLHEIGHHAIGFNVYKPRCLEEYHAWRWALQAMHAHGLNITDAVRHRMHMSLWYAVAKARRRGIRAIPEELTPYLNKPSRPRRREGLAVKPD